MNLRKKQQEHNKRAAVYVPKEVVHNFSSYKLSKEEHEALSYSLDYHIPSKVTRNSLNTEFEMFFQNLLNDISAIPEENLARIKMKLRSTCEKYYQVKPYFKYNQVTQNLSKNNEIVILKQDKGRRVMILDRSKYMEKYLSLLSASQFDEIDYDLTAYIEGKVQRTLRKIKNKLPSFVHFKIYPTGSLPGKFYGAAKVHKVPNNSTAEHLPLKPIISNIGTATYDLAKYLAQLLKPLSESRFTIKNSKTFTKMLKKMRIPPGYKMVSFDVVSLFTNVPLDETIDIIIKRIYDKKEINTDIPKKEMRELLYLCTKNAHFTLNNKTYLQVDGVAMGSPLGPVLANIFMAELERNIIPTLFNDIL